MNQYDSIHVPEMRIKDCWMRSLKTRDREELSDIEILDFNSIDCHTL